MDYLFTFFEGVISFISPCMLPMIPIYISYFFGKDDTKTSKALFNSICFVLGFTLIFIILSILASQLGSILSDNMKYIKILFGIIIILLGLNYMDVFKLSFLNKMNSIKMNTKNLTLFKSFVFGMLFSISWTPCISTFLGSALLLVAQQQDIFKGISLILVYSIGLGIPFIVSVLLIDKMKSVFNFIKKNYNKVKKLSGIILVIMGIYMIFV